MGNAVAAREPDRECRAFAQHAEVLELIARFRSLIGSPDPAEWITLCKLAEGMRTRMAGAGCGLAVRNAAEQLFRDLNDEMRRLVPAPSARLEHAARGEAHAVVFGAEASPEAARVLGLAWATTPHVVNGFGRYALEFQAYLMHDQVHEMLVALGRMRTQGPNYALVRDDRTGRLEPLPDPDNDMDIYVVAEPPDGALVQIGAFAVTAGDLRALGAATDVVVDDPEGTPADYFYDPADFLTGAGVRDAIRAERDAQGERTGLAKGLRVAVVGPVHVVFDAAFRPQAPGPRPLVCVSIPAPDFAAKTSAERARFVVDAAESRAATARVRDDRGEALLRHLGATWRRALACMREAHVDYACLCAIGCGAFKGRGEAEVVDLPSYYARALCRALAEEDYGFRGVVVATPVFVDADGRNHAQFADALTEAFRGPADGAPRCPVLLTSVHSMIDAADRLARDNPDAVVGLLNPSDATAVRAGYLGMYFDGGSGTIAVEELLALQTTLLMGHVGLNPGPWSVEECLAERRCRFVDRGDVGR
jgi:hypothetical protein